MLASLGYIPCPDSRCPYGLRAANLRNPTDRSILRNVYRLWEYTKWAGGPTDSIWEGSHWADRPIDWIGYTRLMGDIRWADYPANWRDARWADVFYELSTCR